MVIYWVFHFSSPCNDFSMITVNQLLFPCKNRPHLCKYFSLQTSPVMSWSGTLFSKSSRLMAVSKIFMFNTCRAYMLTKIHRHSMSSNNQRNIGSSGSKSWQPCAWQMFPQDQVLVFLCMSLHKAKHPYIAKSYLLKWWKVYMWLIKNCALRKPK